MTAVNMILGLVAFFIILRLIFRFFSADTSVPFVEWIYAVSNFLIMPFAGIVPNIGTATGVIDVVAVVTLLIYLTLGYLAMGLLQNLAHARMMEEEYLEEKYPRPIFYHEVKKRKQTETKKTP